MKSQLSNKTLNLHADHDYALSSTIGAIQRTIDNPNGDLEIEAKILSKYAPEIKEMLDIGINLGLSIGGQVTDYTTIKSQTGAVTGWEIKDIKLFEISLTSMPANWDTYGTVTSKNLVTSKCLSGACYTLLKNQKEKGELIMPERNNNMPNTDEMPLTEEKVVALINEGLNSMKEQIVPEILEEVKTNMKKEILEELKKETGENNKPDGEGAPKPGEQNNGATKTNDVVVDTKSIAEEITSNILKELDLQRKPASVIPNDIDGPEPAPTTNKKMSIRDIAKNLA